VPPSRAAEVRASVLLVKNEHITDIMMIAPDSLTAIFPPYFVKNLLFVNLTEIY
jgi:hypothetical protein